MILSNQPAPIQAENAVIYLTGLFMYRDEQAGNASALAFLKEFDRGVARFDNCTGSYRIRIVYRDGREIYFSDNAGIMRWYIGPKGFCTSLREAAPDSRTPDETAIAQFLSYGCIYGPKTVIHEVKQSESGKYYLLENGDAREKEKGLTPFEELDAPEDALAIQMRKFSQAVSGREDIACTITGGTDSRTILAHMIYNGLHPLLDITGKPTDGDVVVAKRIAECLNEKLLFVPETPEGADWIDEAVRDADGMQGVCGTYRLYKKARVLSEQGVALECGGLNGEMYKNDFISQDFPFYGGKPRWERFLSNRVAPYGFPVRVCGPLLTEAMEKEPGAILQWLRSHTGKTKFSAYLSAGHEILQGRAAAIGAMNSRYYIWYTPLMERNVAAPMFRQNPHALEMQAFQRGQVSTYCPAIKDIETDRGLTCDSRIKTAEYMKGMKSIGLRTLVDTPLWRKFKRGKETIRIDTCFQEGLSSPQYHAALERCKELGIIAHDVTDLPTGIADRVFALGTFL